MLHLLARVLTLAEEIGVIRETGRALAASAMVQIERGDLEAAQRLDERALALGERSGNLKEQARAHCNAGCTLLLRGDAEGDHEHYRAALEHQRQCRAIYQRLGAAEPE